MRGPPGGASANAARQRRKGVPHHNESNISPSRVDRSSGRRRVCYQYFILASGQRAYPIGIGRASPNPHTKPFTLAVVVILPEECLPFTSARESNSGCEQRFDAGNGSK